MNGNKVSLGRLKWVNPTQIKPSEENPRNGEFYKDKDFLRLRESVTKYGVIVPIIIKELYEREDNKKYHLIDGERRWKAAVDTNQDRIPAYVLPPERKIDILTTMFQIHMNQEGWDAIEQAIALEKIISFLKHNIMQGGKSEEEVEKELLKKLREITGMDQTTALSRIRFFRWPESLRDKIYNEPNKNYYSYAVEIEAKIVEPTLRNFPDIKSKISPNDMREALFAKVTGGYVSRAEEIRDAAILTKRKRDKKEANKAQRLILRFIKNRSFTFPEAREQYFYVFPKETQKAALSHRKLVNTVRTLVKALKDYTIGTVRTLDPSQRKDLRSALDELLEMIKDIIKRLD